MYIICLLFSVQLSRSTLPSDNIFHMAKLVVNSAILYLTQNILMLQVGSDSLVNLTLIE